MIKSGFYDSDSNESYRCLIKAVQKEQGSLPSVEKHADMLSSNKLQGLKEKIGELHYAKFAEQQERRELNKVKRDMSKGALVADSISNLVADMNFAELPKSKIYKNQVKSPSSLIICLSDIHYGADFSIPQNEYNPEMSARLLDEYAGKLISFIKIRKDIIHVHVVNLGDSIEHAQMRQQNTFEVRKTVSEQVTEIARLIWKFLARLSEVAYVTYEGIAGNHDRLNGNYKNALTGDTASTLINQIIRSLAEVTDGRVEYVEAKDYYFTDIDLMGHSFAFVHGDKHKVDSNNSVLSKLGDIHNKHYDAVIAGHIHHYKMTEVGENRFQVNFGSFKGIDPYAVQQGFASSRSQGIIVVNKKGYEIRRVTL